MDRVTVYPASIPRSVDLLTTNRNTMVALGLLAQELFGTPTIASGFACTPTSPTSLNVSLAGGRLYSVQEVDPLQYSTLPADTTDLIVKQGIQLAAQTLSCPAPTTSGQSINYLIEASFAEVDTNPVVLPYYNANNPALPFSGPNGNGSANYTTRADTVQILVKSGTPATTGTQVTPAPDTGNVGLWVVTVAYGQTTITTGNISQYPGAPLLGGSLLQAIQSNAFTYGADIGTANAYAVNYAPAVPALVDGMTLEFQAANANTTNSTFSPNGITAAPILGGAHAALQGGEIASGSKCVLMWKANLTSWVLLESTGGALQISPGTKSAHAVNLGQFGSSITGNGYTKLPNGLIIQWGTATATGANSFPIPFPNVCFSVTANFAAGNSSNSYVVTTLLNSLSAFTLYAFNSTTGAGLSGTACYWMAIGY
ncbi:MAG: phage tail protein [Terriglobia bacterium]|nr:phage tail protein [Terriglobia bacterium]